MKALKRVIVILLIVAILFIGFMYGVPFVEKLGGEKPDGSSWMADLPDDIRLNEITIPGTHDSATQYVELPYFANCQYLSIKDQLEAGYRYLDIRLGNKGNSGMLSFYHGFCVCTTGGLPGAKKMLLGDQLDAIYDFLEENPTETVIFCIKMEHCDDEEMFQSLVHWYLNQDHKHWYMGTDAFPSLGDCRGKVVLMRRYADYLGEGMATGIGISWENQSETADAGFKSSDIVDQDGYTLVVQDRYKYDDEDKWQAFIEGLKTSSGSSSELSLNFLSTNGSSAYGHPYSHAKVLNERFMNEDLSFIDHPVWIITDFSFKSMAQRIWELNFR